LGVVININNEGGKAAEQKEGRQLGGKSKIQPKKKKKNAVNARVVTKKGLVKAST